MRAERRVRRVFRELERFAGEEGIYFDLLLGELPRDQYDQLTGNNEVIHRDPDGTLVYGKRIHLAGGTVTVETSYERRAAA